MPDSPANIQKKCIAQVKDVYKVFPTADGGVTVLSGVNLDIYEKEFLIVFGPSGCGKTTLLNSIIGLEPVTSGEVTFYNFSLKDLEEDDLATLRKRNLGIIYQQQFWIKSLNVVENVAFPLFLQGIERKRALWLAQAKLAELNMGHRLNYYPMELSSGEQQRVSLIRSLVTDPKIIIADEPTGNLDYRSGMEMMKLLKVLRDHYGKTVILVTHNPDHLDFANRIVFMLDGKIKKTYEINGDNLEDIKKEITEDGNKFVEENGPNTPARLKTFNRIQPPKKSFFERASNIKGLWLKYRELRIRMAVNQVINSVLFILFFLVHLFNLTLVKLLAVIGERVKGPNSERIINRITNTAYKISDMLKRKNGLAFSKSITDLEIIDLSFRNLLNKRSRSVITILGMGLGIGFIVFLVSIGYGLEKLVISRIASLDELKHVDVNQVVSTNVFITDKTISDIRQIQHVKSVYPSASLAGRVEYKDSATDIVANGVQGDYLKESSLTLIAGSYFNSNQLTRGENEDIPRDAVVNEQFLLSFGLENDAALGEEFEVTFVDTTLIPKDTEDESLNVGTVRYKIVGVVRDADSPLVYVPIVGFKELGIERYSQLKVILTDQGYQSEVRRKIEAIGYSTTSILDTVSQVEALFNTVRTFLTIIGLVALLVSMLGMFNTLTISLLERTREVGLMKVIGMKTQEVMNIFLTESMIMSVFGGVTGLILGYTAGKLASVALSIISVSRGEDALNISSIPVILIFSVIAFSVLVGVVTGIYPAHRATKIPALNALRYE